MSAIDYAIHYKYPEAALAMVVHEERGEEVLMLRSDKHPCVTLALIASMPRVFEAVQDKCITKANCKKDSKSFYVSCFPIGNYFIEIERTFQMPRAQNFSLILSLTKYNRDLFCNFIESEWKIK